MIIDDKIKKEKIHTILAEKLQKYHPYHQAKLHEYLTGKEILPSSKKKKKIEQAKFTYYPLGKSF